MYVSRIKVSGIRGFFGRRALDLRLTHPGWTVLAGRNGSGKTTLLRAIALAVSGPYVAHALNPGFPGWVSVGLDEGAVEAEVLTDPAWDLLWNEGVGTLSIGMSWEGESGEFTVSSSDLEASKETWMNEPRGWFIAGYGPFRRLSGGASESQRLMRDTGRVAHLASLFHEDVSLAESVSWLIDLHLRRLEERPGAADLLRIVIELLNDGLLPDGFKIERVDSEGLWVVRDGHSIALRELSDGYRTVTALVLDLVRRMDQVHTLTEPDRVDGSRVKVPGVVLIDEIDAHLHVSWQKKIGGWLKDHFPQIQFIVTSHSPYICQSADPGGLIRLAGLDEDAPPRVVDEDLHQRIVNGSGDDALLTDLFGVDSLYSDEAERNRHRLVVLERAIMGNTATPEEEHEYRTLRDRLKSTMTTRVSEVAARIVEP
ncbi:AAA family ATPase [Nonomuraea sp. FMUSA5-5]|uniref:AAA family ATPase n=1 Tax=Nonomuraea composti TaxID=2720023 RepID=A0ABX1BDH1_9ACTN|nr:AAA family ATPase [Nonomuraea sp. FMUSA5-5]NJP93168.1 AAA family ATPase [Nonomuraea sp. FMUSA5-5]